MLEISNIVRKTSYKVNFYDTCPDIISNRSCGENKSDVYGIIYVSSIIEVLSSVL